MESKYLRRNAYANMAYHGYEVMHPSWKHFAGGIAAVDVTGALIYRGSVRHDVRGLCDAWAVLRSKARTLEEVLVCAAYLIPLYWPAPMMSLATGIALGHGLRTSATSMRVNHLESAYLGTHRSRTNGESRTTHHSMACTSLTC